MNYPLVAGALVAGAVLVAGTAGVTNQLSAPSSISIAVRDRLDIDGNCAVNYPGDTILHAKISLGQVPFPTVLPYCTPTTATPTPTQTPLMARLLTPAEAIQALYEGATDLGTPGPDGTYGAGRLDICKSFNIAATITANPIYICTTATP